MTTPTGSEAGKNEQARRAGLAMRVLEAESLKHIRTAHADAPYPYNDHVGSPLQCEVCAEFDRREDKLIEDYESGAL